VKRFVREGSWLVLMLASASSAAESGDWGTLRGRFVYGGQPPAPKPITVTTDHEYCGKYDLVEERLLVDPVSRGVANVTVWLYLGRGAATVPIHEAYRDLADADVLLDSTHCRVDPHVSLLRTTQTLRLRNTDPIGDGLKIDAVRNQSINILLPPNGETTVTFPIPERLPIRVGCPVHPWESGWLFVSRHPYMAVSRKDGRFEISNLPCGTWTFQFWHEAAGYVHEVTIHNELQSWTRGRTELAIERGINELGDLLLAPGLCED